MQTQVQRLRDILEFLKPVVPRKTALPVLTNVLVKDRQVSASDAEVHVAVAFPEAQEPLLLPYIATLDFLKTIPGYTHLGVVSSLKNREATVSLLAGDRVASFKVPSVEDYPPAPQFASQGNLSMSGDTLVRGLREIVSYCAREESRPVLTGVMLALGEEPALVAADGFRLAVHRLPGPLVCDGNTMLIIPHKAVSIFCQLWAKGRKEPTIPESAGLTELLTATRPVTLDFSDTVLRLRGCSGQPGDWAR